MSTTPGWSPAESVPAPRRTQRGARAWARRRRATRLALYAAVLILGSTLVLAGMFMLVLPGPGLAAIILGLVVLASEFAWAEQLLAAARSFAERGVSAVRRMPHARTILATLVLLSLVAGVALLLLD